MRRPPPQPSPQPLLRRISDELEREGDRWSSLVEAIVASDQFRMRRAPDGDSGDAVAADQP